MTRLSFPNYALLLASAASMRSEDPHRKVGAVAFSETNKTLATAYNGLAPGVDASPNFWENREKVRRCVIHAEQNLVSLTSHGAVYSVAVTTAPCSTCAALLAAHGVRVVYYGEPYESDSEGLNILTFYGVKAIYVPPLLPSTL